MSLRLITEDATMHIQSLSTLNPDLLRGFRRARRRSLLRAAWAFFAGGEAPLRIRTAQRGPRPQRIQ